MNNTEAQLATKVPTTIFSGFLGSGKTTIISSLVDQLQSAGEKSVYIKNEIGNEDVDARIMRGKHILTKKLLNGCICCTLVGPFLSAIDEVVETTRPDRILIEASGTSDPSAIALMVSSHPKLLRDGVVSIIDVVNFEGYKDLSVAARKQAEFTDLIVFNKVELTDLDRKRAVVGYVRELNEFAPIIEAPHGVVQKDLLFGTNTKELVTLLSQQSTEQEHHQHLEEDHLETFVLSYHGYADKEKILKFLESLPKEIIRVKGFCAMTPETILLVNKVGQKVSLQELPNEQNETSGKIVCIGFRINQLQNMLSTNMKTALV